MADYWTIEIDSQQQGVEIKAANELMPECVHFPIPCCACGQRATFSIHKTDYDLPHMIRRDRSLQFCTNHKPSLEGIEQFDSIRK